MYYNQILFILKMKWMDWDGLDGLEGLDGLILLDGLGWIRMDSDGFEWIRMDWELNLMDYSYLK